MSTLPTLPIGCFSAKVRSPIPPARLFKAFVESKDLMPKAVPKLVKSVDNIEGDGGPGTIRRITYADGKHAKQLVGPVDSANYKYSYSVIEGDPLGPKLEKISADFKIAALPSGGSILTLIGIYEPRDDYSIKDEEVKAAKESAVRLFNAVNEYLIENPDAYI